MEMKEGKARMIVTILLKFYHRNDLIKDRLRLTEQKKMARAGVFEVTFNEYIQKQLVCNLSIKRDDLTAKVHAIKYTITQLYRAYQKKDIEDLEVYFDGDLLPEDDHQSYLKIKEAKPRTV
jgi:hypothetical protein